MAERGAIELSVIFGPSRAPALNRAIAYARRHADELGSGTEEETFRARFALERDQVRYGRAFELLGFVAGLRSTLVEIDGAPEPRTVAAAMVSCARTWLRRTGACRERFPDPQAAPAKCLCCPLWDPGWAAESSTSPRWMASALGQVRYVVPEYPPEE